MGAFDWRRRLQKDQDELFKRLEQLTAVISRIETEWADTKNQVRRSYQRLEKAGQRANPSTAAATPPNGVDPLVGARSDPFSKKLAQIRSQADAVQPGADESTG